MIREFQVPKDRVVKLNEAEVNKNGAFVLYWIQTTRRVRHNFGLQFAIEKANELKKPIVVLETLGYDYPWACDRFQQFVLEGVSGTKRELAGLGIPYLFYMRKSKADAAGVSRVLGDQAALVVTDDFPCFIFPERTKRLLARVSCPVYTVDSNGVVPLRLIGKQEQAARTLRPKVHDLMREHFSDWEIAEVRYPSKTLKITGPWLEINEVDIADLVEQCDINHAIKSHERFKGGREQALKRLGEFVSRGLPSYGDHRNEPNERATSDLSPYLHYGFVGPVEVALEVQKHSKISQFHREAFLEELIVRRELAYNFTFYSKSYDKIEGLPPWAQETLRKHQKDKREHLYSLAEFENAQTHDQLWNAAQTELVKTGIIHGYVRMLWGKKIVEWTQSPDEALKIMIELNNKYALDGCDPNSYTNFMWCLGLHDRPWFPERDVFGCVRYMSVETAKDKFDVAAYVKFVSGI